jgi:hypothetical protein
VAFLGVYRGQQIAAHLHRDNIQADFRGDNAKLIWPVSLDGKKMQSETYKILGVLGKPKNN